VNDDRPLGHFEILEKMGEDKFQVKSSAFAREPESGDSSQSSTMDDHEFRPARWPP
jgi:hypothetical protein